MKKKNQNSARVPQRMSHPFPHSESMKNPHYTEIAFILDRSGSMSSCETAARDGFNQFLGEQQNVPGLARLTLVLFDHEYLVPARSIPVQEVVPLNDETYQPRGQTALLDAIGQTIDDLGRDLAARAETDRPGQVIVAILTDGYENASERFTWKQVSDMIKHQTDAYKWTFLFLGANQDAIATAAQISIAASNAASYVADADGTHTASRVFARKMSSMRIMAQGRASLKEEQDAQAPLASMLQEEDEKLRKTDDSK